MSYVVQDKNKILARIRRIRGQAEALEKAVTQNEDATAMLQQIAAIRGAVNGLLMVVLEGRVHGHADSKVPAKQHHLEHRQLIHLLKVCLK
jgi:DNA-binding FrmR family transcriptional regulator